GQGNSSAASALDTTGLANLEAVFRAFTTAIASLTPIRKPDAEQVDTKAAQRERITFKLGNKPPGTAGRGRKNRYNLQRVLQLDEPTYSLIQCVAKHSCIRCNMDMRRPYGKQPSNKLTCAQEKLMKAFPEFRDFDDPYWPINTFLLVVLKGTSQAAKHMLNKIKKDKEAKKKATSASAGAAPTPVKGGKAKVAHAKDEDPAETLAQDLSISAKSSATQERSREPTSARAR
ncbi:hypothetical protein FRC10_006124, partial [Ceratobasidium sp. 414]